MISWKDFFAEFEDKSLVRGGIIGAHEAMKVALMFAKRMEHDDYVRCLERVLKKLEDDREELFNEEFDVNEENPV